MGNNQNNTRSTSVPPQRVALTQSLQTLNSTN